LIEGGLVVLDGTIDALDLGLDDRVVLLQVFVEARPPVFDPLRGLALDPRDL
jgi:hypothetical protein